MIRELIWRVIAWVATRPAITQWLIERAQRTPYIHITSADGNDTYMGRWWLFNPYGRDDDNNPTPARWQWLPSVRIHNIMRADHDRHLHDHPWNARTIVLRGWYEEERFREAWLDPLHRQLIAAKLKTCSHWESAICKPAMLQCTLRQPGDTGRLLFGQYHRISHVSDGGVWTMFWTWRKRGTWGFDVDGVKVPWRKYLGLDA